MSRQNAEADVVVECDDVVREYTRGQQRRWRRSSPRPTVRALDGVSMQVSSGEFLGIAGPSGSGKSTLLHLLAALDTPTEGTIELDGQDTTTLSERQRARLRLATVGIVFQQFYLLPSLSARGNVALPLIEHGVSKSARRDRAADALRDVGLGDRLDHQPAELSGGEQQRVAIARALITDPPLVVADEPTGELDTETGDRILDVFDSVVADDRAVVVASHDANTIDRADRVLNIRDGKLVDDSST